MSNLLTAIRAIIEDSNASSIVSSNSTIQNRANQMGDALEEYVKEIGAME